MRTRLPNRRRSISRNLEHRSLGFTCTFSQFADGRIAEVFLTNHKVASAVDVDARDAAIILSFALQHGADLVENDPRGNPTGIMGAVLDLLAKEEGAP
jgi:hypothetical protein